MKAEHGNSREWCRSCYSRQLEDVLDLGIQPPSNALLKNRDDVEKAYPLKLVFCKNCYLAQLDYDVPPNELFGDYVYFSSMSAEWLAHTKAYASMIYERLRLNADSTVIEIGSNDGSLLENLKDRCRVLGVDPSHTVASVAQARGVPTLIEYFGLQTDTPPADLIIANNVLAHTPDPSQMVAGMRRNLKDPGTVTIEFPHVLNLLKGSQFDTIYHEHYSYFSLLSMSMLLGHNGLYVYDVEELPTHGGSLRVYARSQEVYHTPQSTFLRILDKEFNHGLNMAATYAMLGAQAELIRYDFEIFQKDHRLVGYGAAAKGNTFLNYCGAKNLEYVADVTPAKIGKFLPGSRVPVVSEDVLYATKPPYVLILPWNWKHEIAERLKGIRAWGGKFVTAIPKLEVW